MLLKITIGSPLRARDRLIQVPKLLVVEVLVRNRLADPAGRSEERERDGFTIRDRPIAPCRRCIVLTFVFVGMVAQRRAG